jgi:hypothetical protein
MAHGARVPAAERDSRAWAHAEAEHCKVGQAPWRRRLNPPFHRREQFVPPYAEMRKIMADVAAALTELCRRVSENQAQGGVT